MAHYFATISHLDAQVGKMLDVLRRRGLENTLVIYTADHGDLLGYHHLLLKGSFLYDPLVRVPLVIGWQGETRWPRDARSAALVESLDVTRTILDVAGVEPTPEMQGRSLTPVLRGETDRHREAVFAQHQCMAMLMLRTRECKLIHGAERQGRMLFHLATDPCETENLYTRDEYAAVRGELEQGLLAHLCRHARPPTPSRAPREPGGSAAQRAAAHDRAMAAHPCYRGLTPYANLAQEALEALTS